MSRIEDTARMQGPMLKRRRRCLEVRDTQTDIERYRDRDVYNRDTQRSPHTVTDTQRHRRTHSRRQRHKHRGERLREIQA